MSLSLCPEPSDISKNKTPSIQSATKDKHSLRILWTDKTESVYHYLWLRDKFTPLILQYRVIS